MVKTKGGNLAHRYFFFREGESALKVIGFVGGASRTAQTGVALEHLNCTARDVGTRVARNQRERNHGRVSKENTTEQKLKSADGGQGVHGGSSLRQR